MMKNNCNLYLVAKCWLIIFYSQGWDDPYIPRTHQGLLKWKYPEMNSVDFLFEVVLSSAFSCSYSILYCCKFYRPLAI